MRRGCRSMWLWALARPGSNKGGAAYAEKHSIGRMQRLQLSRAALVQEQEQELHRCCFGAAGEEEGAGLEAAGW